jgi:hypothetical protein
MIREGRGRRLKRVRMQGARQTEEGGVLPYAAPTKAERNAADAPFSASC